MKKLFSIEKQNFHKVVKILGIKMKFKSLKEVIKFAENEHFNILSARTYNIFLWSNRNQLTSREKLWFLGHRFYKDVGYFPNLKTPKSFNEKINWMKLNYYNPIENICIDKYEFKNYISEKLGEGFTIPTIGVYENIYDINFDDLPNQFVIKTTTNGSRTGVDIVKDKSKLNLDEIKMKYSNLLQEWNTVYYSCLSRGYKEIKPRIIIEKFVSEISQKPYEYKFFCFHGEPKLFYAVNYNGSKELTYYDMNLDQLPFTNGNYKMNKIKKHKPSKHFDQMVSIAKTISKDFPFVRVDFYDADKLYIGELTFTPTGGFAKYKPVEWDYKMGEMLDLSKLPQERVNIIEELRTK